MSVRKRMGKMRKKMEMRMRKRIRMKNRMRIWKRMTNSKGVGMDEDEEEV